MDFINHLLAQGRTPAQAVIDACAVRAQPIALTALAAMAGAVFIIDDPIFNGLGMSLLFGILVSTVLTLAGHSAALLRTDHAHTPNRRGRHFMNAAIARHAVLSILTLTLLSVCAHEAAA